MCRMSFRELLNPRPFPAICLRQNHPRENPWKTIAWHSVTARQIQPLCVCYWHLGLKPVSCWAVPCSDSLCQLVLGTFLGRSHPSWMRSSLESKPQKAQIVVWETSAPQSLPHRTHAVGFRPWSLRERSARQNTTKRSYQAHIRFSIRVGP